MCKFKFRLITALLTFGIGVFTVSKLFWKLEEPVQKVEEIKTLQLVTPKLEGITPKNNLAQIKPFSIEEHKFTCTDSVYSVIWKKIQKEDYFSEVLEEIDLRRIKNCNEMFGKRFADLNKDNVKEVIVRGKPGAPFCGATGNCTIWVLGKKRYSSKYKLLLETGGEYFHIRKNQTNGYQNLYVTTHDSVSSSYHMVYKFSGKSYQETKCWFEDYGVSGERTVMSCAEKTKQSEEQLRESEAKLWENGN